ncbi:hypothetical protein LZ554_008133 [Drepanopeziza brunnea f. sp. 'monogermtubi']|nr:hypothetical protein LZ554_008133 [Drepanopeziza brunnea f. sp. 'monogermtubi']
MLPPPGFEAYTSLENASTPTSTLLAAALKTAGALTSTTLAAVAASSSTSSPHDDAPKNGECELLGPFAILVQGSLGLCALTALVYKRYRERPQRPLKIWFFDVSKQVVGSVLVHIANLLMSMLSSGQFSIKVDATAVAAARRMVDDDEGQYSPNPCSFYLLNLAIDTTIGIPILIGLLRLLTALFTLTPFGSPPDSIRSGNYGSPPRAWWWLKQSIIYFLGLMGMKICVLIIFLVLPWISRVGDWALRWTEGDEVLQVVFVMLVFPVIMNATQYYIIDSFIKNQTPEGHESIPEEGEEEAAFLRGDESVGSDAESEEVKAEEVKRKARTRTSTQAVGGGSSQRPKALQTGSKDYDPLFDGETSPTVVGSASTGAMPKKAEVESDDDQPGSKPSR